MGFVGINDQNKQRVNISKSAYNTLEMDVKDFHLSSKDALINRLLLYRERHLLNTDEYVRKYKTNLICDLKKAGVDITKSDIVDKLVDSEIMKIKEQNFLNATHKRNQKGFYMRISKNARRWLESDNNTEELYYSSLEQFINTVIEDYAGKSNYERECIIFDEFIERLSIYIKEKVWLNLYNAEHNTSTRIYPIVIDSDVMNTHAYLACYQPTDDGSLKPVTYRISSLSSEVVPINGYEQMVSDEEYNKMSEMILERGIQFLSSPAVDIEIKLNEYGIRAYERTLPLRPDYVSIRPVDEVNCNSKDAIYRFHCTERQAEYYFFRFGRDAQILFPNHLRERFIALYKDTLLRYASTENIQP